MTGRGGPSGPPAVLLLILLASVTLLLEKGADLETTDGSGRTAWMYAAMGDQVDVVEIFKKARAKKQ